MALAGAAFALFGLLVLPSPASAQTVAGAIGRALLLLGTGGRALRGRARG